MGLTMNRIFSSGAAVGLAMIGITSCSDNGITDPSGMNPDDLGADASRIASVAVTAASSSIKVGETTQATATLLDYRDRVIYTRVNWSSSDTLVAAVSSSGLITGVGAGAATITASRGTKSGSVAIAVAATSSATIPPPDSTPPPPPPPPPAGSVEPAGMTPITDRAFSALSESSWYTQNSPDLSIQQDLSAPRSPSSIIQMRFPAGFNGGASPAVLEKGLGSRYHTIYIAYWMKLSNNWYGHPTSNVNKQMHVWINGGNHVFTLAEGSGTGPLKAEIWLQGTAAGERNLYPNLSSGIISRGDWHRWEIILTCNTGGAANGVVEWWLDGVKVGSYTDVRLEPSLSTWELIQWSPTWGGTGSTVPADQFESLDHIYISGRD